jgi:hypothetical protein
MPFQIRDTTQLFPSDSGFLGVLDSPELPFSPSRIYWIHSVPTGASRGNHAHKNLNQFFIALKGSVRIEISDSKSTSLITLSDSSNMLFLESGLWRRLFDFSEDAVILVGADSNYDASDYIHDWEEYLTWREINV